MATRKSLYFSFLDRYASLLISIVSSMVIARLLTPAEIGVFSITMVLLMFVSTVRDMGAGQYLVQEKELTLDRIRAVWAVQLGLGLTLACVVLLASYPVALFYKEPRMQDIMLVVALNYVVNPFGSLTYAWLIREMRFEAVALMRFIAALGGALVSTYMAWRGYGPISLAYGALASTTINAMVAIYFRPKSFPWLPGVREVRRVLSFGSMLTASSIVNLIASSAPELLLGKLQNIIAVGLYSRANGLVQMFFRLFVDAVSTVCLPWFAKQSRENGSLVEPFLKATAYVTAFGWSFCLAVVCLAQPIIKILYGDQWGQSVDLARLLAIAMAFSVPTALCGSALLSIGVVTAIARITVLSALQSVLLVAIGVSQGLIGLGVASIAAAIGGTAIALRVTLRHIDLPVQRLLISLRQSAAVAVMASIGPALALWVYGPYPEELIAPLALGCSGGAIGFVLGILVFNHPLQEEIATIWSRVHL